jgi:hypothetical protein
MRIQKTKEHTFLVVETDTNGETFPLEECYTYTEAVEAMEDWARVDAEWEDTEYNLDEEI